MMMMTAMIFSSNVKGTTISSVVIEYPVKSLLSVPSSDSYWVVKGVYMYIYNPSEKQYVGTGHVLIRFDCCATPARKGVSACSWPGTQYP